MGQAHMGLAFEPQRPATQREIFRIPDPRYAGPTPAITTGQESEA